MTRHRHTPRWLEAARQNPATPRMEGERPIWLSRALARAGALLPEEVERAIAQRRIRINGQVATQPLVYVRPSDRVEVDGRIVSLATEARALMFHKPAGCVVSTVDPHARGQRAAPTVFELLDRRLGDELKRFRWHAIGRLDRKTTGLLLFTNDERLVEHATRPESHLSKRYLARVYGTPSEEKLASLRRGLMLDDGPTLPAEASVREADEVVLTIREGRNHQVKRMLGAVGLPVRELHREAVGELVLDVAAGELRELSGEEIREKLRFSLPPPLSRPS